MSLTSRRKFFLMALSTSVVAACSGNEAVSEPEFDPPLYPNETPELRALINQYADFYEVPRDLVQRVVIRESTHRPWATNGPNIGLMQIQLPTARGMGYTGDRQGLLDAETNLTYAVKYLRGAYLVAGGNYDRSVFLYAKGYYPEAKRAGLLKETGLAP
ncbi:lytic transglycosylase domain-containing protein [Shimia sp. MMG029]|uniref:lytic transglycosylase domain-containing protein n=1 Tax=Shimia sp. MMG029 TaxID=3021978 RepID=UPI0022FDE443|nr:lytic transglycosylase domain-containing protein [Shimia sp. MMG029]MDA5555603.1 lytic transglycosylase domain-containing protein [Shimia sp. MMG029]